MMCRPCTAPATGGTRCSSPAMCSSLFVSVVHPYLKQNLSRASAVFDCLSLYPPQIVPEQLLSLQSWYKDYYNDQLVIRQPSWFRFFSLVEALYQLPISVWSIWALTTKSPKAPTHLLVWAVICCGTTLTCLFEFYHNEDMNNQEKGTLIAMYGSYAVICKVPLCIPAS